MLLLTEDAIVVCKHQLGKSDNAPSQHFVRIDARRVLIEPDPVGRTISGCPNYGPSIKPCTTTLKVQQGYSAWIRIGGSSLCLDTLAGYTDGTPPGIVQYIVNAPGQQWVNQR
jgi:hypothetical protein